MTCSAAAEAPTMVPMANNVLTTSGEFTQIPLPLRSAPSSSPDLRRPSPSPPLLPLHGGNVRYQLLPCRLFSSLSAAVTCSPKSGLTILFANAGVNQVNPIFLGTADPSKLSAASTVPATPFRLCRFYHPPHRDPEAEIRLQEARGSDGGGVVHHQAPLQAFPLIQDGILLCVYSRGYCDGTEIWRSWLSVTRAVGADALPHAADAARNGLVMLKMSRRHSNPMALAERDAGDEGFHGANVFCVANLQIRGV